MADRKTDAAAILSLSSIEITPELLSAFLDESGEHVAALTMHLMEFERQSQRGAITFQRDEDRARLTDMFRAAHSLKGLSATFGFDCVNKLAHHMESVFDEARAGRRAFDSDTLGTLLASVGVLSESLGGLEPGAPRQNADLPSTAECRLPRGDDALTALLGAADRLEQLVKEVRTDPALGDDGDVALNAAHSAPSDVRVSCERMDAWISSACAMAEHADSMATLIAAMRSPTHSLNTEDIAGIDTITKSCQVIQRVCDDLCVEWEECLLVPVGRVFHRFTRLVENMTRTLGRRIELVEKGADLRLDARLAAALADPLTHMIRNAVDHGIEPPDERMAAGKPITGTITLSAREDGEHVVIEVRDDGRGVNVSALRRTLSVNGHVTEADIAAMSDEEMVHRVFEPGVTTAARVSEFSGRGMGMDIVRAAAERWGGFAEIATRPGEGTTVMLRIPRRYRSDRQPSGST